MGEAAEVNVIAAVSKRMIFGNDVANGENNRKRREARHSWQRAGVCNRVSEGGIQEGKYPLGSEQSLEKPRRTVKLGGQKRNAEIGVNRSDPHGAFALVRRLNKMIPVAIPSLIGRWKARFLWRTTTLASTRAGLTGGGGTRTFTHQVRS